MIRRVVIVPRWGGGPDDDFYPWLADALGQRVTVVRPRYLRPDAPRIEEWVPVVLAQLWAAPAETLILGHSVGCRAALHALSRLRPGLSVGGLLCVAGWWTVDTPWPTIEPWLEPLSEQQLVRARAAAAGRCRVLLSDDDPYTTDHVTNGVRWREGLGAEVEVLPGGGHFNGAEEPAVLTSLEALLSSR
jgi:predicted alpha/beta hydrolase family esterase